MSSDKVSPLAGREAPRDLLVNIARLVTAYFTGRPDARVPEQKVAFGTSGHRGVSFRNSFNEWHVLAISQAICEYRKQQGITGPLLHGMPTPTRCPSPRSPARWKCWRPMASMSCWRRKTNTRPRRRFRTRS